MAMEVVPPMVCELIGGPMDGDTILMQAVGSVAPPPYLWYPILAGDGSHYLYHVYQGQFADNDIRWGHEHVQYRHIGRSTVTQSS